MFYYFIFIFIIIFISEFNKLRLYIGKSEIHGSGLFTILPIKKGDIILDDIFSHKIKELELQKDINDIYFDEFISREGANVNHCSNKYNADVYTKDNKKYSLIAIKDISINEEITANYDIVHNKYPFISGSREGFIKC